MQSVSITTKVVSSNHAQAMCTRYNIIQLMTLDEVNTTIYQPQRSELTEIQSHQLFYYMSKSEVSDILVFFFTVIVITPPPQM